MISFPALITALVILLLAIISVVWYFWPRDEAGDFLSPEEVQDFLNKFPKAPTTGRSYGWMIGILAVISMIAVALTSKKSDD